MASALLHVIINVIIKLNLASIATIPLSMHLYLQILDNLKGDGEGVYIILIKLTEMGTTRIFFSFLQTRNFTMLESNFCILSVYQFPLCPYSSPLSSVCVCLSLSFMISGGKQKKCIFLYGMLKLTLYPPKSFSMLMK